MDSSRIDVGIHAFTKPAYDDNGAMAATAEYLASKMASAIVSALDNAHLPIPGGMHASIVWARSRLLMDPHTSSVWHAVVSIVSEVAG